MSFAAPVVSTSPRSPRADGIDGLLVRSPQSPEKVEKEERSGGVYVKAPDVELYVKVPVPDEERVFAERSVREIPPPPPPPEPARSGAAIHLEVPASHFRT